MAREHEDLYQIGICYRTKCQSSGIVYKADYRGLNYFIADFYCDEKKAVIELDGQIHKEREEYDSFRDNEIKEKGLHVIRIKNEELENMDEVLQKIDTFLKLLTS